MNEQERIERFNLDLEDLIQNGSLNTKSDDADLLRLAYELSAVEVSSEHQRGKDILVKATQIEGTKPVKPRTFQRTLLASVAALIIVVLVIYVPPFRALAQEIVHRIGSLTITNEPTMISTLR